MRIGVLDPAGLLELFSKLSGRRLLGVVDGGGFVELVFDDGTLVSIGCEDAGRWCGLVLLGSVAYPADYVRVNRWSEAA
jgi:hypothetical protein